MGCGVVWYVFNKINQINDICFGFVCCQCFYDVCYNVCVVYVYGYVFYVCGWFQVDVIGVEYNVFIDKGKWGFVVVVVLFYYNNFGWVC